MTVLAALLVLAAVGVAAALCWPAARRTGLGAWHPAMAWLALHAVFFGLGSARLALDGRSGPALYVAGAALVFGAAVASSDRLARGRSRALARMPGTSAAADPDADAASPAPELAPLRPLAVAGLAAIGVLLVLPTLARVGLPFLVPDITGARSELAGPELQLLRVAIPALALAIVLNADAASPVPELAPLRPLVVAGLAALGVLLVLPTLARVGLPFLVSDITGARSELAGPELQVLRVAIPALALAIVLNAGRRIGRWLIVVAVLILEVGLASRYLAAELLAVLFIGIALAGWRLRPRLVLAGALSAVLAFGGIQVLRTYDQAAGRELAFALDRTINRVVLVQPRTLEALQAAIPAEQPYYAGLTWLRRLGPVLGRPDIPNLGYWVYPRIFPGQEPPGYAAPGLIGEAWANFGPFGLGLFGLLGLGAERLGVFVSRRRYAAGDLIAGTLAVVFLARTHALGLNGLAFLIVLVAIWRALAAGGLGGTRSALQDVLRWRI